MRRSAGLRTFHPGLQYFTTSPSILYSICRFGSILSIRHTPPHSTMVMSVPRSMFFSSWRSCHHISMITSPTPFPICPPAPRGQLFKQTSSHPHRRTPLFHSSLRSFRSSTTSNSANMSKRPVETHGYKVRLLIPAAVLARWRSSDIIDEPYNAPG